MNEITKGKVINAENRTERLAKEQAQTRDAQRAQEQERRFRTEKQVVTVGGDPVEVRVEETPVETNNENANALTEMAADRNRAVNRGEGAELIQDKRDYKTEAEWKTEKNRK
jgi:lactam utilization protein B